MTYASKRTRARNVETGLTEAQDAGAVFMFDADWMNAQYNTTGEALRANPRTYRDTRYEGDGLYLVGREDEPYDFTEIALATDREVTIPAGKWKAMDTGEMWDVQMADEATAGKFWTAGGFEQEIDGTPIPEAASAVNQAFDDFVESLTVDERAFLAEQLEGNFDDLKTWNETTRYGGDGSDDPGAILGDILADEKAGTDYGDDTFNSIARKFEQYLMGDHANAVRLFANRAGGTRNVHRTIDDAIRERIGLSNLNIKVDGVIGHSAIDPLAGKSALNNIVREGFEFRGLGNWENIGDQGWSPFIESFDDLRERMIDEIAAQLHRPENVDFVKRAEQMINLKDGSPVARPPADGVTRIYTPVVPADSSIIDDILVSLDEGSDALRGASVSASRVFRNLPTSDDPVWEAISHVEAMALADDVNGDRWDAIRGELLRRFENGPTENPWEDMADLIEEAEALLSMRPPVKGMTGTPVNSYAEKARRVLARNVATRYADPVIDAMTEEQRIELVGRMLRLYDESKAQYGLGMSQALEGMAFDDPRIAKWLSSLMGNGMDEAPLRVGQLEIPRSSLINNQGYPKTGVRLGGTFGDAGREWQFDARYANRAAPVEAPAFHHVPYEYTDESGLVSKGTDVVVGRSVEEAYRDWAEQIADTVLTSHRRGVREKQVFKGQRQPERQIARRVGDKFEELGEGEVVNGVEDFYAVKDGKVTDPIQFGDNRFFDHVVDSQEDDLMWNILGPMIRDHYEAEAGMSRKVARTFKEHKGMFGRNKPQPLHESLTTDQEVRMTRSRVDDVHNEEGAMLPNVAIVQGYDMLHDTVWDRIVRYGFDKVIGPAIDSIVRKPMAFHYFAAAYKQQKRMFGFLLDRDLFEVSFANEFAPFLDAMRSEAGGLDNVIDQVRLVAKEGWGVELDNVDDVRRWVISASEDSDSWRESLDAVQKQARQRAINASVKRGRGPMNAEGQPEWGLVTAIDDVRDNVNRQAVLMSLRSDGIGARTDAEALVKAYHEAVPEHLWDEGHDAVTGYLRDTDLPSEVTPDQWRVLKQARANMAHALNTAEETATLRAIENVIPYLDSHEQRSLLAEYGRNFVPFWYAEENFLKRWARTFALGQFGVPGVNATIPSGGLDTLRRAQLTYMGIKSAGAIRTDANGEDWVVYPGSSLLTEAVSKILPGDTMPIGVLYAASTDSLLPGLTDENHISPSPFVAMPAHFVAHIFPDARPVKDALLGPIGSQRSIISQFVPSAGQNFWNALFQDEDSSVRYASAMNAAIAYAEAEGNGLPDSASAAQVDEYLDRIRNHARIIMVSQAIAGFVVPGSPRPIATGAEGFDALTGLNVIDPEEITSESYRKYIQELGIEDGTAAFLRAFPNADLEDVINPLAFTSSATESVSRAPLPATEQGVSWYEDNKAWIDASPEAGAWFIPQDGQGEFEYAAYRQQLVNGLRKRRTPQEFIHAIKYRTAAEEYFRRKDQIDVALEQVGDNRDAAKALNSTWDSWQKPFLKAHPIFAEELAIGTARVRRSRTVEQMRYAANDPAAPDSPYLGAIREIVKAYDSFNAAAKALRTRNDADSREMVRGLKGAFSDWGEAWALSNPGLERLWTSVYRLEARIE